MDNPLISVIIPTFNRAHLIGETLDSISAQTYENWECIIVDDGSTDNTEEIIEEYVHKDSRFQIHHRTIDRLKGANACRNIGLDKSNGDYIVFFDSDDLMTPNHLEVKIKNIISSNLDYIITRTAFFNKDNTQISNYYKFDQFEITPYNYVTQKINWLTYDIFLKSHLAKKISFNENLQSGQEYNYFCKLTYQSTNARFINEIVTLRRHHDTSIRSQLKTRFQINQGNFRAKWFTYLDIRTLADKETKVYLVKQSATLIMAEENFYGQSPFKVFLYLYKEVGFKFLNLIFYLISMKIFKRGHYFRRKFKQ